LPRKNALTHDDTRSAANSYVPLLSRACDGSYLSWGLVFLWGLAKGLRERTAVLLPSPKGSGKHLKAEKVKALPDGPRWRGQFVVVWL